ncbi:hypothetical protein IWZ03DRAFT_418340 [Phyllosticta citriasiana]|uniref:Uncharacterized protein n=1 Tax=Phyllosticta citriasiana TaxID=595635 RepID=A0ABR1KAK6_9PEZI
MSRYIARSAPAMVQWTTKDGPQYMGLGHPAQQCSVSADLGFEAAQHEATLRLCVSVGLKEAPKKVPLYVLVYPNKIHDITVQAEEAPGLVANAFIARVPTCSSSQDVCALRILLQDPSAIKIIGLPAIKSLTPTKEGYGKIIEALRSLSYTTHIMIYLPISLESNSELTSRIGVLCDDASSATLQPGGNEYALKMLYGGAGGQDISSLLQDTAQSPPSYDELAPPEPLLKNLHAKRPTSSPSDPSRQPKKPRAQEVTESWARRLLEVELETSKVQRRQAEQDATGSPTENASVADHFERLDDTVSELRTLIESLRQETTQQRKQMAQQQDRIQQQQRQIMQQQEKLDRQKAECAEKHSHHHNDDDDDGALADRVEDYLYECGFRDKHDTIHEIVEDVLLDFRRENDDWLEEQLEQKLPALLRRSLRRLLPRALEQVQLRVGFTESGAGWRWLDGRENVRLPGEQVDCDFDDDDDDDDED